MVVEKNIKLENKLEDYRKTVEILRALQAKYKELEEDFNKIHDENDQLKTENKQIAGQLRQSEEKIAQLDRTCASLTKECADAKEMLKKTQKENVRLVAEKEEVAVQLR